jgi:hypothetical protein
MGAGDGRERISRQDGERVTISLPAHVRKGPVRGSVRRLLYRAEPARDWEPRLDRLWERARHSYPIAVARDADRALRRFAGHPTVRHHRFLALPRFSDEAVAFAVFVDDGSDCRWMDLVWDHDHPGALELLAHISGRLAARWGSNGEHLSLIGDEAACAVLKRLGFRIQDESVDVVDMSVLEGLLDGHNGVDRAYLTAADLGEIDS